MIATTVVLVCAAAAFAGAVVVIPDNVCSQVGPDGVERHYPINATWPSHVPGECIQYICNGPGPSDIGRQGCVDRVPNCSGENVCYQIGLFKISYPYCCVNYYCESEPSL